MARRTSESTRASRIAIVLALVAAVGAAAFLAWRRTAPLSRHLRRRGTDDRGRGQPDPQRNPGTVPVGESSAPF